MWNSRKWINAALVATVVAGATGSLSGVAAYSKKTAAAPRQRKPASDATARDFKFPIVLCRFKQAVLKKSGAALKVVVDNDWGPEYAFPVENIRAHTARADNGQMTRVIDGDFSGIYEIADSSYRLRLEGAVQQGIDPAVNHQLRMRTFLEKRLEKPDASGNVWQEVGQSTRSVIAKNESDGAVWENIYPYTVNTTEMQNYFASGRGGKKDFSLKRESVIAGIRDGLLDKGSVFKVGPACGFLDAKTAKSVVSRENRTKFKSIFDKIPDSAGTEIASAPAATKEISKTIPFKLPEPIKVPEKEEPKPEPAPVAEPAPAPAAPATEVVNTPQAAAPDTSQMSPELMAQIAQQQQLAQQQQMAAQEQQADQAAAAYNFQTQVAQQGGGAPMPGTAAVAANFQMPQVNTVGQMAENIQNLQNNEQVQQHLSMLEQQKLALAQQQGVLDQQELFLRQKQQSLAEAAATTVQVTQAP